MAVVTHKYPKNRNTPPQYRTRLDVLADEAGKPSSAFLRDLLAERGSDERVGEVLGVDRSTVWRWKRRYIEPPA